MVRHCPWKMCATPRACIKPVCFARRPLCHKVNLPSCVARRPLCHKVNLPSCVARRPFCHKVNLPSCVARRPLCLKVNQPSCEAWRPLCHKVNRQDFRTGPYFIMHTLLCFKKTITITIDVLWDCGALFFLFRGFFLSLYGLKKSPSNFCLKYGKSNSFFLQFRHFSCNFTYFSVLE